MRTQFDRVYKQIVETILNNIAGRKLVLRYKDLDFENYLFAVSGIRADFYITRNKSRANNKDTFLDEIVKGGGTELLHCYNKRTEMESI